MQSFILSQIFGKGAFPDENVLIINKSSLLKLTPSANNTAESLLVAILITALVNFQGIITDETNNSINSETNQPIDFENSEVFELIKMIGWKPFLFMINEQYYINHKIIVRSYAPN